MLQGLGAGGRDGTACGGNPSIGGGNPRSDATTSPGSGSPAALLSATMFPQAALSMLSLAPPVKRADVAARLSIIAETGRVNANRARSALSGLYSWAIGEGIAESNPVIGTNKPADEKPRERFLSREEIRAVWNACRADDYGVMVKLLQLTAQRKTEVENMDGRAGFGGGIRTAGDMNMLLPMLPFTGTWGRWPPIWLRGGSSFPALAADRFSITSTKSGWGLASPR